MGGTGGEIVLVLVLVLVNAVFSGSEMALVSLRDSQVQRLERQSRSGHSFHADLAGLFQHGLPGDLVSVCVFNSNPDGRSCLGFGT